MYIYKALYKLNFKHIRFQKFEIDYYLTLFIEYLTIVHNLRFRCINLINN